MKKKEILSYMLEYMELSNNQRIGIPTIDRIVLKKDDGLVYEGKLGILLKDMLNEGLIENSLGKGYGITQKGLFFLGDG